MNSTLTMLRKHIFKWMDPKIQNVGKCSPWIQHCYLLHIQAQHKSSLQSETRKSGVQFKMEATENQQNTATKYSISKALINQAQVKIQEWPNNHHIPGLIKRNSLLCNTLDAGIPKTSTTTLEEIKHIKDVNTCEARMTSNTNWQVLEQNNLQSQVILIHCLKKGPELEWCSIWFLQRNF